VATSTSLEQLKAACDAAHDKNLDSCSHAVWDVVRGMGFDEPYRQANELIDHLSGAWKVVTVDEAHTLASGGVLVVGGLKAAGHGHVIVVYPGQKKARGGYEIFSKKAQKMITLPGRGTYPLCMSTSLGSWPGAKSRGDKTVWDPWGDDAQFDKVRFFTPKE